MKISKFWGIVLSFTMIISHVNVAMAKEQEKGIILPMPEESVSVSEVHIQEKNGVNAVYGYELNNGSEIRIEENEEKRIAEYYVDDVKKQIAILDKSTGVIYYYDLNRQNVSLNAFSVDTNVLPDSYTEKYNIQDYVQTRTVSAAITPDEKSALTVSSDNFKFLKSKSYTDCGVTYMRYLYGYTDNKQYRQNSWHFPASTAASIISAACGFLPGVGTALSLIINAAGITVSAFAVQEWIKEFFWVYKFKQTTPTAIESVCGQEFTYKKQRKVEINGDEGYWETIEEQADWEIEAIQEDILQSPGYYI